MKQWESLLSENDRFVIESGGWGKERGLGKKPALLIIDLQYNYVGDDLPFRESIKNWPASGGEVAWGVVRKVKELANLARSKNIPVVYSRQVQKRTTKFDGFADKRPRKSTEGYLAEDKGTQIVDLITPTEDDIVIEKSYASIFFGTPLITYLIKMGIDTLIFTGCSTSGCVRASLVDAVTRSYRAAVVEDCVFDRIELSHKAALLDIWMKYGDLVQSDQVKKYLIEFKGDDA